MGWGFRKYIQIAPGVKVNLSKSGVSTTIGKKGASVNIGKNGTFINTGIPGTGLYSRQKISNRNSGFSSSYNARNRNSGCFQKVWGCVFNFFGIASVFAMIGFFCLLITNNFEFTKDNLYTILFYGTIAIVFVAYYIIKVKSNIRNNSGFMYSVTEIEEMISKERNEIRKTFLCGLKSQYDKEKNNSTICIDNSLNERQKESYKKLCSSFDTLCTCDKIWIEISRTENNENKSSVSYNVNRRILDLLRENFNDVGCRETNKVPMFSDGVYAYYLYPMFIVKAKSEVEFEIFSIENAIIKLYTQTFVEDKPSSQLPNDAKIVKYTYKKVNKDGTPDLRYNSNKKLPVYQYGKVSFNNIGIILIISNYEKAKAFTDAFTNHKFAVFLKHEHKNNPVSQVLNKEKYEEENKKKNKYATPSVVNLCDTSTNHPEIAESHIICVAKLLLQNNYVTPKYLSEETGIDVNLIRFVLDKMTEIGICDKSGKLLIHSEVELLSILHNSNTNHTKLKEVSQYLKPTIPDEIMIAKNTEINRTTKNSLEELNNLIGLHEVKKEISNLCNLVKIQKIREERGMKVSPISYHCVFIGNSGTGKTTVARIVAKIYKELGVLKKGHLIETDRSGLVGEYVGQTAPKTNAIIDSALDGILFIDEAYSLVQGGQNDYGKEAISTLLKRMEDDRDRLVVILAGYSKEMEKFINSNSGLHSRFNRFIDFTDYTVDELMQIFSYIAKNGEMNVSKDAMNCVREIVQKSVDNKDYRFGNARFIRNLYEKIITQQANRLSTESNISDQKLSMIEVDDVKCLKIDE